MKTNHAPGPWTLSETSMFSLVMSGDNVIATVNYVSTWGTLPGADNARLIAAAPDLLAALEELERLSVWLGGSNPVHDAIESAKRKARAAIAKATGGAA